MKSVYIETYGCQMNVADTEVVFSILGAAGYGRTEDITKADVIMATPAQSGTTPSRGFGAGWSSSTSSARAAKVFWWAYSDVWPRGSRTPCWTPAR